MGIKLPKVEREVIELSTEEDYQDKKDDGSVSQPVVSNNSADQQRAS